MTAGPRSSPSPCGARTSMSQVTPKRFASMPKQKGKPMKASAQVSDPAFSDRYVAETRELLATVRVEEMQ